MAQSPAHRFGQIIGEVLEAATLPVLQQFAREHGLYLDKKGDRPCRRGKKCSWLDLNGNAHDLDFVLERGGTPHRIGMPAAFIETAWRRYTKHSRNKVQKIQGAIEPLAETYRNSGPFKGAVLAGVFTGGALTQLKSLNFTIIHMPYKSVVAVFRRFKIDAAYDEKTPDEDFQAKVDGYEGLSESRKRLLAAGLIKAHQNEVNEFVRSLAIAMSRQIERIVILALHGESHESLTVDDAIRFVEGYEDGGGNKPLERYEIEVRYNNGDSIRGNFRDKAAAIEFLKTYQPVTQPVR
ncbi:MAG: hypothetical protein WD872_09910 [Pirellulaceae bacterium]